MSQPSVQTVIIEVDSAGQVVQHDQSALDVLVSPDGGLLGARLSDLVAESCRPSPSLAGLLAATAAGREFTGPLTFQSAAGNLVDAVVTVQPMQTSGATASLATLRILTAGTEVSFGPAMMRQALLYDPFRRIGTTLDLDQVARGLVNLMVPGFCHHAGLLVRNSLFETAEPPAPAEDGSCSFRRLATAYADSDDFSERSAFPSGEIIRCLPGSPYVRCVETGKPVLLPEVTAEMLALADRGPDARRSSLKSVSSVLILPLALEGTTLGVLSCGRGHGSRPFSAIDAEIGADFACRAAAFLDNARQYSQERATAVTLQRSMLPTALSAPSSVDVHHRYLPGSQLIEVGGDWYESIALPGARVMLVIGDVAGHGVRAAATMGRLRAALQTMAMMELPPPEALHWLDQLMRVLGEEEPHFATCAYAVYNAVDGTLEVASAGHPPLLLAQPDGSGFLDVSPAPPLGVGENPISSKFFDVADGSLLVLYTDGLVESRGHDIDEGLARLPEIFTPARRSDSLESLANDALSRMYDDQHRDDVALLIARLRRVSQADRPCWTLTAEPTSAARARVLATRALAEWHLEPLAGAAELIVSELVTNAIQHAGGTVLLRLIRDGGTVTCEVGDSSRVLPLARHAADDDESGRGLQVVSQLSHRWGVRRTRAGKLVWCELRLP